MKISVSGIEFFNNTIDEPFKDREGAPDDFFALEYSDISTPLPFSYLSDEAISSFVAVKVNTLGEDVSETSLSTSLVVSDGTYHTCTGLIDFAADLDSCVYYFKVNDKYESAFFGAIETKNENLSFELTINTALGTGDNFQLPLPSGQTYNFVVNWGDSSEDTITAYNQAETLHPYSSGGIYQISITGKCGGWSFNNLGDKLKITSVDNFGDVGLDDVDAFVYGCSNLTSIDCTGWDSSNITSMVSFAFGCTSLTSFICDDIDVSNVTLFTSFIRSCSSLTSLPCGTWDVGSATLIEFFANGCTLLTSFPVTNWTAPNVTSYRSFIQSCSNLASLDVSGWSMSNVNTMLDFARSSGVTALAVDNWSTGNFANVNGLVRACSSLVTMNTDNWDTSSITACISMCNGAGSLTSSFDNTLWWNRTIPIASHTAAFTGAINVPEYPVIPASWGGGGA